MIGLLILGIAGVYLVVSLAVVVFAANKARAKGRNPWKWGGGAALVMYLLVFWDWVPTVVIHRYTCATESGYWVYKTADQWKSDHPGVFATLTYYPDAPQTTERPTQYSRTTTYRFNQRFARVSSQSGILPLNRFRNEQSIVDTKTGEVLAKYVVFSTGYGNAIESDSPIGLRVYKLWLNSNSCGESSKFYADNLANLSAAFYGATK